jgi:hypothetical protein
MRTQRDRHESGHWRGAPPVSGGVRTSVVGDVLFQCFEHGRPEWQLPGEGGDQGVLRGHGLQVADPALQLGRTCRAG